MYNPLDDIESFIEMLSRGVIPGEDGQPLLAEQEFIERIKSALFYSMMKRQCGTFPIPGITAPAVTNYTEDKQKLQIKKNSATCGFVLLTYRSETSRLDLWATTREPNIATWQYVRSQWEGPLREPECVYL